VASVARSLPPAARAALGHAYRVGFTDALTSILMIAALVATAGAVAAFVLVRSRDFVDSAQPEGPPEGAPVGVPAG
jgi:hypothetical protein